MNPSSKGPLAGLTRSSLQQTSNSLSRSTVTANSLAEISPAAAPIWLPQTSSTPLNSTSNSSIYLSQISSTSVPPMTPAKTIKIIRNPPTVSARAIEQKSLQETLRTLAPEGGENDTYWLPVAVARLGLANSNVRTAGLNLARDADRDLEGGERVDVAKAIMAHWERAAKTEEKLYEMQAREQRKLKMTEFGVVSEVDGKKTARDFDEDDEELQELLDELRLTSPTSHFKRVGERRSKRFTSAFEEEISQRNEHLRLRMEHMNARVKRFEKGFEALGNLAVKMDQLAESSKLRVQFLEQCLVPLYNESARHQICRNNAEKALTAIDAALHHYQVPDELMSVIQAGPVKNLPAYCAALERVKASVDFFSEFHTTTPEFDQVSMMYRMGRDNLIKEYRDLLRMHSKAVPSVMIYDAIMNNLLDPSISHDFAHFAETVYNDLQLVTQWFRSTKDVFDFMDVYASFRTSAMRESLEQFRTFYKEAAEAGTIGGAANEAEADRKSMTTSAGREGSLRSADEDNRSLSIFNADEAPTTGGGRGIFNSGKVSTLKRGAPRSTPRKKAVPGGTHGSMAASLFQKLRRAKAGSAAGKKSTGARIGIDDDTYQKVEIYMASISAFLKLVESEVGLMYGIIPDEHMRDVFDRIVLPAIERFGSQGKELAEKILIHVQNGDFSAVLLLLQVLEHFEALKALFVSALEGCTHDTQMQWTHVQQVFRAAVQRTMDGFLTTIKTSTDRVLPSDGTVHEITSNTIAFLSNLVDYRALFDSLAPAEAGKTERKNVLGIWRPATASQPTNFPQYLNSVVTHLLASLTTRAENYNDPTLKAIFLLNNISYMFNYLKQAGIIDVMKEDNPSVDKLISKRTEEQGIAYADCWTSLSKLLTDAVGEAGQLRTKTTNDATIQLTVAMNTNYEAQLKEKDRQVIKDRCTAINKEIIQQTSKQDKYSVPDQNLRSTLLRQNRNTVVSLYNTFRERYVRIPFTKFPDKYLPYTTQQVSDMLDRFFSQDAFSVTSGVQSQTIILED